MFGKTTIIIRSAHLCEGSKVAEGDSSEKVCSIDNALRDPVLRSFVPSMMPSAWPFFKNNDGFHEEEDWKCAYYASTEDTGTVCFIDESAGTYVATYSYDIIIVKSTIETGSIDAYVASKVMDRDSSG